MLAKQIINLDFQLIAANTKQFSPHPFGAHPFAQHPFEPQPVQLNDMAAIVTERPRQVPNLY